ncbi:MAG: DUF1624 domain-containing protein [Rubrobacter sp.]|nr:DUF1624 domain-containing protein [Rubrobacter sp.]
MMALYHTVYDLDFFGGYGVESTTGFWARFADATAGTFVFLVGVSLTLSFARSVSRGGSANFGKYLRRGVRIFGYGLLITAFFALSGAGAVVFGILQLIGVCIILAYPLLRFGWANVALGLAIIAAGVYLRASGVSFDGGLVASVLLAPVGITPENLLMPDYRPLLPWFGVCLLGVAAGNLLRGRLPKATLPAGFSRPATPLAFLGRNSLFITSYISRSSSRLWRWRGS